MIRLHLMPRPLAVRLMAVAPALVLVLGPAGFPARADDPGVRDRSSRPNIIFIFSDDHATQAIGAYGSTRNATPSLDRLAAEGLTFDRMMCGNAICAPSRATILTGTHSHVNGLFDNAVSFDGSQPTFPKILQRAGYETAIFGKWHLKSDPTGFDTWMVLPGQGSYYNPDFRVAGRTIRQPGHSTERITDAALAWLAGEDGPGGAGRATDADVDADEPFLLMVQYKGPHRNWMPAPEDLQRYAGTVFAEPPTLFDDYAGRNSGAATQEMEIDRHMMVGYDVKGPELGPDGELLDLFGRQTGRMDAEQRAAWETAYGPINRAFLADPPTGDDLVRWKYQRYMQDYLAVIAGLDRQVGRLLDAVDAAGLREDTIVIYSSDQGFFLGEHGWYDKRWMYEESLRMPFIARWPGVTEPGTRTAALAQNIDIAQTFLEAAGVPAAAVPDRMQGRSLVPLLEGEVPADWRDALYYRYYEAHGPHAVPEHYGIRTDRYKLIRYPDLDEWELFDLDRDPDELRSVHAEAAYAAIRARLEGRLTALQAAYGDAPEMDAAALFRRVSRERAARAPRTIHVDEGIPPGASDPILRAFDPSAGALRIELRVIPRGPDGVLLAHGGASHGYAVALEEGRVSFSVRDLGRLYVARSAATASPAMGAPATITCSLAPDGTMRVAVNGVWGEPAAGTVLTTRPAEGLELGMDSGSTVGGVASPGPFVGAIRRVRIVHGGDGGDGGDGSH